MAMNGSSEHHCLVSQSDEDCNASYERCEHKDRHKEFIPVPEFREEFLHPLCNKYRDWEKEWMDAIIALTVRVVVTYVSLLRPDRYFQQGALACPFGDSKGKDYRRVGTGFLYFCLKQIVLGEDGKSCPCPECKNSTHPKTTFWTVFVSTATHVVFDTSEAKTAKFELFYESNDRKSVKYLYGTGVNYANYLSDSCQVECVTHDDELGGLLKGFLVTKSRLEYSHHNSDNRPGMGADILVSHPHGMSKRVSVGRVDQIVCATCSFHLLYCCLQKIKMKEIQIVYLKTENEESGITNTPNDNPCKDIVFDINGTHFPPCLDQFLKSYSIEFPNMYYNSERNAEEYSKVCTALDEVSVEYDQQSVFFRLSDGNVAVVLLDHEGIQHKDRNGQLSYSLCPGIIISRSSTGKVHRTTKGIQFRCRPDRDYKLRSRNIPPRLYYSMAGCPGSSGAFVGFLHDFVHLEKRCNTRRGNRFGVDGNSSFNGVFFIYGRIVDKTNPNDSKISVREGTAPRNPAVSLIQRIWNYFKRK